MFSILIFYRIIMKHIYKSTQLLNCMRISIATFAKTLQKNVERGIMKNFHLEKQSLFQRNLRHRMPCTGLFATIQAPLIKI